MFHHDARGHSPRIEWPVMAGADHVSDVAGGYRMTKRRRADRMHAASRPSVALLAIVPRPPSAEPRAVIELFTSQGCSSCPDADKLAGELARDPSLVVMSLPIDNWDYLGWKDTLAKPGHTNAAARLLARPRRSRGLHAAGRRQRQEACGRQRPERDRERDRRHARAAQHALRSGEAVVERRQVSVSSSGRKADA